MADNADNPEQHYQPEQTGMYELEFPAPQLSSSDGRGPVMIHALEGFSDAGHAIRLAAAAPEEHAGHRAGGVVRHRRTAGLPVAAAADDVQDRPLHPLRGSRAEPVRPARQRRDAVSAAGRHGAGPAAGSGSSPRCGCWPSASACARPSAWAPSRWRCRTPGRSRMTAHSNNKELIADHRRGSARCRCPAACRTCWSTGWPSTATRWSASPCTSRTTWRRPTTRPPPRRCWPQVAKTGSLQIPLAALTEAAAEVHGQDQRAGRGERRSRSSGGGAGAPVRCVRRRSGEPVAAGARRGSAQRRRTRRRVRAIPRPAGRRQKFHGRRRRQLSASRPTGPTTKLAT